MEKSYASMQTCEFTSECKTYSYDIFASQHTYRAPSSSWPTISDQFLQYIIP